MMQLQLVKLHRLRDAELFQLIGKGAQFTIGKNMLQVRNSMSPPPSPTCQGLQFFKITIGPNWAIASKAINSL